MKEMDAENIPEETVEWLNSIGAVRIPNNMAYAVMEESAMYSYEYLVRTPLDKLKKYRASYIREKE